MQQRVALARALVNLPQVLLLDEPLGALDLKLRKGLQVELKRIQREVGITFVYVTHDQEEALTMSDRIAVMNRGRIEQIGDPEEVYERPDHHLRRRLHRRLQPDAGDVSARPARARSSSTAGVEVDARRRDGFSAGERCHAVVRPEKLGSRSARTAPTRRLAAASRAWWRAPSTSGPRRRSSSSSAGDVRMTVLVPNTDEAERAAAARRRRQREAFLGARAHARGPGVRERGRRAEAAEAA